MQKLRRTDILNKIHLYTVRTLLGVTLAGCALLGSLTWNYVNDVRPVKLEEWHKMKADEIALEQQEKEAELMRRQKEAEGSVKY